MAARRHPQLAVERGGVCRVRCQVDVIVVRYTVGAAVVGFVDTIYR